MNTDTEKPAAPEVIDADMAADLDAIVLEASALEGGAPGAPAPAPPGMTNDENIRGALSMAKLMLAPMFTWWPDFERVWSDGQVQAIASAGGAVCDQHGWDFGAALGRYGPYIALAGATAPPCYATWAAIKQAKAAAEAAERRTRQQGGGQAAPAAS